MKNVIRTHYLALSVVLLFSVACIASYTQAASTVGTSITVTNSAVTATSTLSAGSLSLANGTLLIHNKYALGIDLYTHDDPGFRAPYINFYKSRGTQDAPTAATYTGYEADSLGGINFGGYDGEAYVTSPAIYTQSDENWTTSGHGGHISIYFTRNGATTQNQMVQFGGKDPNGVYGTNAIFLWPLNFYSNSASGVNFTANQSGGVIVSRGDTSAGALFAVNGKIGAGSTTPVANFQVTNTSSNATTTMEVGKTGQDKGSCIKLYRTDGSAIYGYVAAGATSLTLSTTACASVTNF